METYSKEITRQQYTIHFFIRSLDFSTGSFEKSSIFTANYRKIQRSYEKMKGILRPRNYLKFPSVKVIVKEIAYKSLKNSKKGYFWPISEDGQSKSRVWIFFQGLPVYNVDAKHVQTDQGYQSHRLLSDLNTYVWRLTILQKIPHPA